MLLKIGRCIIIIILCVPSFLNAELRLYTYGYVSSMAIDRGDSGSVYPVILPTQAPLLPPVYMYGAKDQKNLFYSYFSMANFDLNVNLKHTDESEVEESGPVELIGAILNFPNPFKLEEGTQIGYELSRSADIDFQVYDIFGHQVFYKRISSTEDGGRRGYNPFLFSSTDVEGYLPAAPYFYFIIHDDKVLGKGKMVLLP